MNFNPQDSKYLRGYQSPQSYYLFKAICLNLFSDADRMFGFNQHICYWEVLWDYEESYPLIKIIINLYQVDSFAMFID